jgi:hypothetical protein
MTARFSDFNFKLLVVEKLMYADGLLGPAFDLRAEVRARGGAGTDYWLRARREVVPEARAYFEALDIPAPLLAGVEDLLLEGGHTVYQQCCPLWDGEDSLFDIRSLEDVALLPGLRRIDGDEDVCMLDVPDKHAYLAARGITLT